MYGLPQAGRIANKRLQKHLKPFRYCPAKLTPGLWIHESRPIAFALWVDNFGVKYNNLRDVEHLKLALEDQYQVSMDWSGKKYVGLTLNWDYKRRRVTLSMPGYVQNALWEFQHPVPKRGQDAPHPCD